MRSSTRNRRSRRLAEIITVLCAIVPLTSAARDLPVFLADNHAETFVWIAGTFDPDESHTLVLIDAHTDASAAERSEEIRELIRRVPSPEARAKQVREWRDNGRIQAFNWIEPLMPRPLARVIWTGSLRADSAGLTASTRDAVESLDGRLEIEPRSSGSFGDRWATFDLEHLARWDPESQPVILSIDLDFFSGMPEDERRDAFGRLWKRATGWQGLRGVSFAVSRPWLRDDEEADSLVDLALDAVSRTPQARLELSAAVDLTPDHSALATASGDSGNPVPRWNLADASLRTKTRLALLGRRATVTGADPGLPEPPRIVPQSGGIDCDHVWRFEADSAPVLSVGAPPAATGRVRWRILEPAGACYDLLAETKLGKDFSQSPARWIHEDVRDLGESADFLLAPSAWSRGQPGRFRIRAECETPRGWIPTGPVEIRLRERTGFRSSLSECLGMPYVFGIARIAGDDLSGVETGLGADCSNVLIHAWRRNGVMLSWGDPGRLRGQLSAKAENVTLTDRPPVTLDEIERGLAIDFGKHVAAVWEDLPPLGTLGAEDLVFHHLGGPPEITTLGNLAASRPNFSLRVPRQNPVCRLAFAGDVVLAGDDPLIAGPLGNVGADLLIANLEGIPTRRQPVDSPKYFFGFDPDRLPLLRQHRIGLVSLANNHTLDAGEPGLLEAIRELGKAGVPFVGAGADRAAACRPWSGEFRGVKLAVFGASIVGTGAAGISTPGIAMLPDHREILAENIRIARSEGRRVVIMLHGGDEYRAEVNDEQRHWARWLSARGVAVVAGSHPHVVQREEVHGGTVILHSLGNAIYPRQLSGAASGTVKTLDLTAP